MRILILGGDGYLGWPTAMRFSARGHEVSVVDNFSRRRWHTELSTDSLTPIASLADRLEAWREASKMERVAPQANGSSKRLDHRANTRASQPLANLFQTAKIAASQAPRRL